MYTYTVHVHVHTYIVNTYFPIISTLVVPATYFHSATVAACVRLSSTLKEGEGTAAEVA